MVNFPTDTGSEYSGRGDVEDVLVLDNKGTVIGNSDSTQLHLSDSLPKVVEVINWCTTVTDKFMTKAGIRQ